MAEFIHLLGFALLSNNKVTDKDKEIISSVKEITGSELSTNSIKPIVVGFNWLAEERNHLLDEGVVLIIAQIIRSICISTLELDPYDTKVQDLTLDIVKNIFDLDVDLKPLVKS